MSIPDPIVLLDARARYVHPAFQMTRASTKTVFDATGKLVTVPANALGWDHDPATGQARGYRAEPPATNLLLHSNDLTQGAWNKTEATVTGDAITGPDGNGMDKIVASAVNDIHYVRQTISHSSAGTVSCSLLCAPGELTGVFTETIQTDGNVQIRYTLEGAGGAVVQSGTPVDYGITRVGDFYRVWFVYQTADSSNGFRIGLLSGGDRTFAGDGTSGAYVGCVQAEAGAYPTSYIETGGATATRPRDNLALPNMSGFPWWNSDRGTLLVEAEINPDSIEAGAVFIAIGSNRFEIRRFTGGNRSIQVAGTNVDWRTIIGSTNVRRYMTLAMAWEGLSAIGAGLGGLSDDTTLTTPVAASNGIGIGVRVDGSNSLGGHIRRAVYYPARISNADLQSLTAIQE